MGGEGIYLVVNEKGEFREDNFQKAMGMVAEKQGEDPANVNSGKGRKGKTKKGGQKGMVRIIYIVSEVWLMYLLMQEDRPISQKLLK